MKAALTILFPIFLFKFGLAQGTLPLKWDEPRNENVLRIVFYNLENLFDTIDDPLTRDEEFLPQSDRKWNGYKYWDKRNKVAKVISNSGGWEPPAIIGVCEIENDTVLQDLIETESLKKYNYKSIHSNSPDRRGIDVGLIYRSDKFKAIYWDAIPVKLPLDSTFKTRDILYIKGAFNSDTLHFFINHWPSRRGGSMQSAYKRINAAQILSSKVDSIYNTNLTSNIIIMGDFNDTPHNESIRNELILKSSTPLTNLMTDKNKSFGTHKYQGHWSYIDQFIISKNLYESTKQAFVFWLPWMVEKDSKHPGYYPKRSWRGVYYNYGFSDHLPIVLDIAL